MCSANGTTCEQCVIFTEFKHYDQVMRLLNTIKRSVGDLRSREALEENFVQIFNFYLEQPHLLDPFLEQMISFCLNVAKSSVACPLAFHFTFRILYLIIKTRGYKSVVRRMPHSVDDIEPALGFLTEQNIEDTENWKTRYVLLLWLSILIMVPFSLDRLDAPGTLSLVDKIISHTKRYLHHDDRTQEAASFLLARLVTRPDVVDTYLSQTMSWAIIVLQEADTSTAHGQSRICGVLRFLASICKLGRRPDVIKYIHTLFNAVCRIYSDVSKCIQIHRLMTKLMQRIGLLFCPPLNLAWQYHQNYRSLKNNLALSSCNGCLLNPDDESVSPYDRTNNGSGFIKEDSKCGNILSELDLTFVDEVADIIDKLINSLRSQYTIVRWSAAKGIGRICTRLSSVMVDDVVSAILRLCTRLEPFTAWHGACLAFAELGRRGLLLPNKLPEVVPIVLRALFYDERSGDHNYGSNVRDAACYVCWAFARAYHPSDISNYVGRIASALVLVSLFDREVNVRRAGSAAFQENVGRQGQFPNGIEILTACDYFGVHSQTHCYLKLSAFVAQFNVYTITMVDHLVNVRLCHWDASIRFLAARALNQLCPFAQNYMLKQVMPKLITFSAQSSPQCQQGCIFGTAELISALSGYNFDADYLASLKEIIPNLTKFDRFHGLSGDLLRVAACHFIKKCSEANLPFHNDEVIETWRMFLDDCVGHKASDVQKGAIAAYSPFLCTYLYSASGTLKSEYCDAIFNHFLKQLNANSELKQSNYLQILATSPTDLFDDHAALLYEVIFDTCRIKSKTKTWCDARSSALKALVSISVNLGANHPKLTPTILKSIFSTLLNSLTDYTMDARGDIGSHVREVGMECLLTYLDFLIWKGLDTYISPEIVEEIMVNIAQQAVEKIDRTRSVAGKTFAAILHHEPPFPFIPHATELKLIFPKKECGELIWSAANLTFSRFIKLLDFQEFRYRVILGLIVSVGGLTELTVRCSDEALTAYLLEHEADLEFKNEFILIVDRIFASYKHEERILIPLLKFLDFLINDPVMNLTFGQNDSLVLSLLENTWCEVKSSKDVQRIKAAIDVFGGMLQFEESVRKRSLTFFMILLCHRYPVIRKAAATKIYEALMVTDFIQSSSSDELITLLTETAWESDLGTIKPIRNQIRALFGLPVLESSLN